MLFLHRGACLSNYFHLSYKNLTLIATLRIYPMTDVKKALLDPTAAFDNPMQVLHANDLTPEQKIEILQRWRYDAELEEIAEQENMARGKQVDVLESILEALRALGVNR
jgi:hypothetical protein